MQSRHFKRLLPLAAVALLILAFLAIELDTTPGPCKTPEIRTEEGRRPLATTNPKHREEYSKVTKRAQAILPKYEDLFWRQPNVNGTGIGFLEDGNGDTIKVPDGEGGCKEVIGFIISVSEKVDQSTLPPEDRIPDGLEGIPVQILEEQMVME